MRVNLKNYTKVNLIQLQHECNLINLILYHFMRDYSTSVFRRIDFSIFALSRIFK